MARSTGRAREKASLATPRKRFESSTATRVAERVQQRARWVRDTDAAGAGLPHSPAHNGPCLLGGSAVSDQQNSDPPVATDRGNEMRTRSPRSRSHRVPRSAASHPAYSGASIGIPACINFLFLHDPHAPFLRCRQGWTFHQYAVQRRTDEQEQRTDGNVNNNAPNQTLLARLAITPRGECTVCT